MAAFYLDYVGLVKTLRGIKNKLDTKVNNSDVSISGGVVTLNGASITPLTDVAWDPSTHQLKQTKGGSVVAIVTGGAANGIAFLDANGKVDSSQLPSYVDDIEEGILSTSEIATASNVYKLSTGGKTNFAVGDLVYDDVNSPNKLYFVAVAHTTTFDPTKCVVMPVFPVNGEKAKIYYDVITDKSYRWGGTTYSEIIAHAGSTDEVPEGSSNLYFTDARAVAALATALAGKADKNGSSSEDFNAKILEAAQAIISRGNITVYNNSAQTVTINKEGYIIVSDEIITPKISNRGTDANYKALIPNSAPASAVPSGKQPNVAYVVEETNATNPGLLEDMSTSEIYDAFAAAGITLGANKTEGEAILDGTTQSQS